MNNSDILSVILRVVGVQQASADLSKVQDKLEDIKKSAISGLLKGGAVAGAGALLGLGAVASYEKLEKAKGIGKAHLFSTKVAEVMEEFHKAVAPTGELLTKVLIPLADFVKKCLSAVRWLNEVTGGFAGLTVVIGLMVTGTIMMIKAAWNAVVALNALAVSANAAAAGNAANSATSALGGAAGGAAAGGAIGLGMRKIGFAIGRAIGFFGAAVGPIIKGAGVAAVFLTASAGVIKFLEWAGNKIVPGSTPPGKGYFDPGQGFDRAKDFWTPGKRQEPGGQPHRRSSIENQFDKSWGRRMSV